MTYHISATKLKAYKRCPYAYYLRYERRVSSNECYGSAALGTALHQALAQCYRDWHSNDRIPDWGWFSAAWDQFSMGLTNGQILEGRGILERYYQTFVANQMSLKQPLAVEGKIQAKLQVENVEFTISGRYDRIDYLADGLELIDYKSAREVKLPDAEEVDLQIGLYYLALEQTYQQSLKYLSLLFLRTGEKVQYKATQRHKRKVRQIISDLAMELCHDRTWQPQPGSQCARCAYAGYCAAVTCSPNPVPPCDRLQGLQLAISF
ncbi:MAG: endonuclease [Alkalinema sp. CACIAM 70d]|nr:MAG: endonuclease [Alkalinema sp. CACIAM 70d]